MFRAFLHAPVAGPERRGFLVYMLPRFTSSCVAESRSRVCPHNMCMLNNMNLIKETTSLKDYIEKAPPKRGRSLLVHHPVEQRVEHARSCLVLRQFAGSVGVQRLVHHAHRLTRRLGNLVTHGCSNQFTVSKTETVGDESVPVTSQYTSAVISPPKALPIFASRNTYSIESS